MAFLEIAGDSEEPDGIQIKFRKRKWVKMADTINELYSKYTEGVGYALEEDRYFQYLFEMIQAGDNTLEQKNRILHKVVDERWLTEVEEGIEAIFNIVDKPRRFITTSEEVVPVALAKKITADSVRHLSQNTQFVTTNEAGDIMPTKILNVTTEESYDLYENRFVYHLIQRLFAFVDKRTDVIFWSTGDETCNVMSMESKVDDAYEEISYKVEMTIKNRQSLVENDNDNMDLFKRIDRVRRMSRTLRASSFCDIMNGCAKVRSPIQRTNLMMKDPDYRTCYKLWQFIEGYDEVGYTIEEQDSTLQFDEEYLLQMYINMITNYTVFKSLLVSDPRKMSEIETKKLEPVKPKFIKEIKEEIVEDRNIPDVEVRKVFVEEVTQAQLDAEEKLREETARCEELENNVSDLEWQMDALNQQMEFLEQTRKQLEEEREALENQMAEERESYEKQLREEKKARTEAEDAVKQAEADARAAVAMMEREAQETAAAAEAKASKEIAAAKVKAKEESKAAQKEAKEVVAAAQAEAEEKVAAAQKEAEEKVAAAQKEAEEAIEATQKEAAEAVEAAQKEAEAKAAEAQREAEETVEAARKEAEAKIAAAQEAAEKAVAQAQQEAEEKVLEAQQTAEKEAADRINAAESEAREAQQEAEDKIAAIEKESKQQIETIRKSAEAEVETAKKAKAKAEAKAEANSLSRYIVQALKERQERKNPKEDGEDK